VGELTSVTLNTHGVEELVSVLVSVVDHTAPTLLLLMQLELEAGVGIGRLRAICETADVQPNSFALRTKREIVNNPRVSCWFFFYATIRQNSIRIRNCSATIRSCTFPGKSPDTPAGSSGTP